MRYSKVKRHELEEITLSQLQEDMNSGSRTAEQLVRSYRARIERLDRKGPRLNAVIELNPDAEAIALALDQERKAKGPRGPLHGIPVLLKDNIDTHDRMSTTAGSRALVGSVPPQDSFVAAKLREAGAVILGKTNLSEWANFRSTRSTSGWSGRGGQTRNPYALDRNPSGSSSGSGVAVSANLCPVAIGTETDGSILSPSSFNGIVGLKPTVGLISRSGIIPISQTQDTAGPMARSVLDVAILLTALAGKDAQDSATASVPDGGRLDYSAFPRVSGLRGARIGVVRSYFGTHAEADRVAESAIEVLKGLGAVVTDPAEISSTAKLSGPEMEVLLYEFKAGLNAYFATLGPQAPIRDLIALIEYNQGHAAQEMPFFGQELFLQAAGKGSLTEPRYLEALAESRKLSRVEGIDGIMDKHQLDALLAPTTGPAHVTDYVYGDRDTGGSTSLAAVAGYPSITVPAGFVSELPVGISLFGRAFSELKLIQYAYAFEQATLVRRAPRYLPSVT